MGKNPRHDRRSRRRKDVDGAEELWPFGVLPQLLTLDNGVTVLAFGRPKQTRTSGYTSLVADGPDSFFIAYDQFDYPNPQGHPRKTILTRRLTVMSE